MRFVFKRSFHPLCQLIILTYFPMLKIVNEGSQLHCLLNFKNICLFSNKKSPADRNKAKVKWLHSQAKQRLISKDGSCVYLIFLKRSERKELV